ncbi:hypothetical protein [Mesorhizobium sp. CAU 1732]|uniref:hypothetical protein n=1 Tax=Mesorhizobium sp. CAU 1732 TaxID=3140358 RepID=UPI0032611A42
MSERRSIAHFDAAFSLAGVEGVQPPGDYTIEHDEELIEALSRVAYRRLATYIHLPAIGSKALTSQLVAIDPQDLAGALARDAEFSLIRDSAV